MVCPIGPAPQVIETIGAECRGEAERLRMQAEHHDDVLRGAEERAAAIRGDRDQLRRDVQAVSADVLRKTGEAMAREIAAERSADQERAAGELALRTEEIKRVVEPLGVKLAQMEDRRVAPLLRRIEQAGASSDRRLPRLDVIEVAPRAPAAQHEQERIARLVTREIDACGDVA